ncbi:MAG TPA: argininosuccinate lyase, partial [Coriobacteriia bacterium]|nr:argininosuccinate lyase [Coriobacteriia bacterium]
IHMAIERTLTERIGPAGARLHTARSRNDQVALDMRLFAKTRATELLGATVELRRTIVDLAERHADVVMPGYTHLQRAQPVLFSHHLLAYFWMLARDATRFRYAWEAADVMPLGSAALAGTTLPIDRDYVAERLGFSEVSANSMDSVSDRDFLLDLVFACSVTMVHLSRICEELIVWSSEEFGFVRMDDTYSTGSSLMPQKRNPDFAELVRGKSGRVAGDLVSLLMVLKGLPLTYNKDMQEDKESAFDAIDTTRDCLAVVDGMLATMRVETERMRAAADGGFMAATDLADYLVGTGMPFRDAHEVVGRLVLTLERDGRTLQGMSAREFSEYDPAFGADASDAVDIEALVARRVSAGGTGQAAVAVQLGRCREVLDADASWLDSVTAE